MSGCTVDTLVSTTLIEFNTILSQKLSADVLFLKAAMMPPIDDELRRVVEQLCLCSGNGTQYNKLVVLLETTGGYIETVERIVGIFRTHYQLIEYVIPNYAYSAGTVLVMSGDEIHMNYHSVLGPIDPQFNSGNGESVPGMGYLAKYQELIEVINSASDINCVKAEMAYLVEKFEPAKLFHIEQAIEHSKSLLKTWLPKHKFKDWNNTSTGGVVVDDQMKQDRANNIADTLGKADKWHSHGRGITMEQLESEDIKLKINDFGKDKDLSDAINNYYSLLTDYLAKMGLTGAIHTKHGIRSAR